MKLFQKMCSAVLVFLLVCTAGLPVLAAEEPTLRIVSATAAPAERVDVAVEMVCNPGIIATVVQIDYDPNVLTLEAVQDGGLLGSGTMVPGGDKTQTPYKVLWADSLSTTNHMQDGTLVVFTFKVQENAPAGDTAIALSYSQRDCFDCNLNAVCFRTESGVVTVTGSGEHTHTYASVVTPPTCTQKGYTTYTCDVCDASYVADETETIPHRYKVAITLPGCTEKGYTTYTCAMCDYSYVDDETDAAGHTFGAWTQIKAPDIDAEGAEKRVCSVCGAEETRAIAKLPVPEIAIENYTASRTVDYRTTITFAARVENPVPGAEVHWFADGEDVGTGGTYTVKQAKKSFTVQAKYMRDGEVLAQSESETVTVKTGFFAKIAALLRALFRKLPVLVQEYAGIQSVR